MPAALVLLAALFLQTPAAPPRQTFFTTPYPLDQMTGKQAVVETDMGTFVIALRPDLAPNHVGFFMKQARDGAYAGTIFHRVIRYGLIQGGDPISRDPAKAALYGTGGLNQLKAEKNAETHTAGAVSAVLAPGKPDSAGAQFFVCATDQLPLDGQYTVFGRVVEGLEVVQAISAVEADAGGRPATRAVIKAVTIRDTPPPPRDVIGEATVAELAAYRAKIETTIGTIELSFYPDKAPEAVRNFLKLAAAGVYDDTPFHRVVRGFVIQGGSLAHRMALSASQQRLVRTLPPEFTNTPNAPGIVSMARGDDPASASTSFFICTGECRALDNQYTVFATVVNGMDIVRTIESGAVDGETPKEPVMVIRVTLVKGV